MGTSTDNWYLIKPQTHVEHSFREVKIEVRNNPPSAPAMKDSPRPHALPHAFPELWEKAEAMMKDKPISIRALDPAYYFEFQLSQSEVSAALPMIFDEATPSAQKDTVTNYLARLADTELLELLGKCFQSRSVSTPSKAQPPG